MRHFWRDTTPRLATKKRRSRALEKKQREPKLAKPSGQKLCRLLQARRKPRCSSLDGFRGSSTVLRSASRRSYEVRTMSNVLRAQHLIKRRKIRRGVVAQLLK